MSLVQSLEWKDFTVLYEDNEGLVRLQVDDNGGDDDIDDGDDDNT